MFPFLASVNPLSFLLSLFFLPSPPSLKVEGKEERRRYKATDKGSRSCISDDVPASEKLFVRVENYIPYTLPLPISSLYARYIETPIYIHALLFSPPAAKDGHNFYFARVSSTPRRAY